MKIRIRFRLFLLASIQVLFLTSTSQAATSADYYKAGLQLYTAKNYPLAVQYFGAAISLDPSNMAAVQGRANCYYALGNKQAALVDYQKVQSVQPNPQLAQFIQTIQAQLGSTSSYSVLSGTMAPPKRDVTFSKKYDIRLNLGGSIMTLTDFKNNQMGYTSFRKQEDSYGNTTTYDSHYPDGLLPQVGLEVYQRFTPELEGGVFFNYLPVGSASNSLVISNGYSMPISWTDSYNISSFMAGFQGRYTFMHGDLRPFFSAGVMIVPTAMSFKSTDTYVNYSYYYYQYYTDTISGNFSGIGVGGQAQAGIDLDLGQGFSISPTLGYQFASTGNFQATVNSSSTGTASQGQTVTLNVVQTDYGPLIEPLSNGYLMRAIYQKNTALYPGDPAPNYSPLQLDLSGIKAAIQFSYNY